MSKARRVASRAAPDLAKQLERYISPAVYPNIVRRNLGFGTVDDIEDAIQKVLVATYDRYADCSVPRPDDLDAYIQRSIRNALIDGLRKAKVETTDFGADPEAWDNLVEDKAENAFVGLGGRSVPPDVALSWKETYAALLDRLPPKYVEVAVLMMSGHTAKEIGDHLGQHDSWLCGYTRKLVAKALRKLAEQGDDNSAVLIRSFSL